jgi:hypothetical protein
VIPVSRPVFIPSTYPPAGHDYHGWRDRHDRMDFQVLVRHRGHWDVVETFRDRDEARRLAHRLRHRGEEVDDRPVR